MNKLISEDTVQKAFASGNMKIQVDYGTIITPQAESVAERLGVEIIKQSSPNITYSDRQKIINAVIERFPDGKYSRAKIEKAVKEILDES